MTDFLSELTKILEQRKSADPAVSYVASLYAGGIEAILAKIDEEAAELVSAGKAKATEEIIHETADLWFHSMVLLCYMNLGPDHVIDELKKRFGQSGIEEKAARK